MRCCPWRSVWSCWAISSCSAASSSPSGICRCLSTGCLTSLRPGYVHCLKLEASCYMRVWSYVLFWRMCMYICFEQRSTFFMLVLTFVFRNGSYSIPSMVTSGRYTPRRPSLSPVATPAPPSQVNNSSTTSTVFRMSMPGACSGYSLRGLRSSDWPISLSFTSKCVRICQRNNPLRTREKHAETLMVQRRRNQEILCWRTKRCFPERNIPCLRAWFFVERKSNYPLGNFFYCTTFQINDKKLENHRAVFLTISLFSWSLSSTYYYSYSTMPHVIHWIDVVQFCPSVKTILVISCFANTFLFLGYEYLVWLIRPFTLISELAFSPCSLRSVSSHYYYFPFFGETQYQQLHQQKIKQTRSIKTHTERTNERTRFQYLLHRYSFLSITIFRNNCNKNNNQKENESKTYKDEREKQSIH